MKKAYPIILSLHEGSYMVRIPDFDCMTQGCDIADAMFMARDVICMMGLDLLLDNKPVPEPSDFYSIESDDLKLMVDVDFTKYRREHDTRAVKKNCTIPR